MNKIFLTFIILLQSFAFAAPITGIVDKDVIVGKNRVTDSETKYPIPDALVKIPAKNYSEYTDENGCFELRTDVTSPVILSVEKPGYKPFSVTVTDNFKSPINAAISKSSPHDIVVDTDMIHLGDNSYSQNSANASDFAILSSGAFYSKNFNIPKFGSGENLYLVIGSVIGIDTPQAQKLGQSHVLTAYSSAPEIYFNNNKIAEIKVNGDNQKIAVPRSLVNFGKDNNVTIKSGRNLYKKTDIDYDDIEFTNILCEILPEF